MVLAQRGDRGITVSQIQKVLKVDEKAGYFGEVTEKAVKSFQRKCKYTVTGIVTPIEWIALGLADTHRHEFSELKCKDKTFPAVARQRYYISNILGITTEIEDQIKSTGRIMSGYRSDNWNKKVGGAKKSQHTDNATDGGCSAIDWASKSRTYLDKFYKIALEYYNAGKITGLGDGRHLGFVHIDRRKTSRAKWSY